MAIHHRRVDNPFAGGQRRTVAYSDYRYRQHGSAPASGGRGCSKACFLGGLLVTAFLYSIFFSSGPDEYYQSLQGDAGMMKTAAIAKATQKPAATMAPLITESQQRERLDLSNIPKPGNDVLNADLNGNDDFGNDGSDGDGNDDDDDNLAGKDDLRNKPAGDEGDDDDDNLAGKDDLHNKPAEGEGDEHDDNPAGEDGQDNPAGDTDDQDDKLSAKKHIFNIDAQTAQLAAANVTESLAKNATLLTDESLNTTETAIEAVETKKDNKKKKGGWPFGKNDKAEKEGKEATKATNKGKEDKKKNGKGKKKNLRGSKDISVAEK